MMRPRMELQARPQCVQLLEDEEEGDEEGEVIGAAAALEVSC